MVVPGVYFQVLCDKKRGLGMNFKSLDSFLLVILDPIGVVTLPPIGHSHEISGKMGVKDAIF